MIFEESINWKQTSRIAYSSHYHSLYEDKELGISKEVITKRTNNGYGIGKVSTFFFINNDDREFTDIDKFIDAYNEKFKFESENPDHEVTYVRVVKLKQKV